MILYHRDSTLLRKLAKPEYKELGHAEVLELALVHVQYMTVSKEGGGDAGYDIMVMFSPGNPITLDPKEERKKGGTISLDPKKLDQMEEKQEGRTISLGRKSRKRKRQEEKKVVSDI
jgi:hypothetical protein